MVRCRKPCYIGDVQSECKAATNLSIYKSKSGKLVRAHSVSAKLYPGRPQWCIKRTLPEKIGSMRDDKAVPGVRGHIVSVCENMGAI